MTCINICNVFSVVRAVRRFLLRFIFELLSFSYLYFGLKLKMSVILNSVGIIMRMQILVRKDRNSL